MLLFINLKKELEMLKSMLLIPVLLVTFSVTNMAEQIMSENVKSQEKLILNLKLEIYKLKEKNHKLQKTIDSFSSQKKENKRRIDAIAQLKRDLKKSREASNQSIKLLR